MTEKIITCIVCPLGCDITVGGEGKHIASLEGERCARGKEYAAMEFINPVRILTTTVKLEGADMPLLPVRSDKPVPKELLMQCMEEIKRVVVTAPVSRHHIVIPDILGTSVNICATSAAQRKSLD